jgi:hypothetical protein
MSLSKSKQVTTYQGAIVAGIFAIGAAGVEGHAANAAGVIVRDPLPHGNTRVALYCHFHTLG